MGKFSEYIREVNGALIMAPEYLLWSKLVRSDQSDKDLKDIEWLLTIEQMSDKDISYALENLRVTDEEIELIESLL